MVDLQHSTGVFCSFLDDRCGPVTEDGIHVHPGQIILFSPFQTSTKIFQSHKHEHINIQPIIKTGKESAYNAGEPVLHINLESMTYGHEMLYKNHPQNLTSLWVT